jgi:nucleotide-binding universal stress UspA family protein
MPAITAPPLRQRRRTPVAHDTDPNPTALAIMGALRHRTDHPGLSYLAVHGVLDEAIRRRSRQADLHVVGAHLPAVDDHTRCPVLVVGGRSAVGPVLVALDDDVHAGDLLSYAAAEATRIGTTLRAVHVWTESAARPHHRRVQVHDSITEADHLLADLLYAHLPDGHADRQVLHDSDPARALVELSRSASLLVAGTRSRVSSGDKALGATTIALLGRTACPLAVLPHGSWPPARRP